MLYFIVKGICEASCHETDVGIEVPHFGVGDHFPNCREHSGAEEESSAIKLVAVDDVECLGFRMVRLLL